MKKLVSLFVVLCFFFLMSCASSSFVSKPEKATIQIGKTDISGTTPVQGRIPRTTFGKYPVKVQKDGYDPLYAILPLHVSGGAIALDALFFAPAAFFNVQGSFEKYEFDLEKKMIRYWDSDTKTWTDFSIPESDKRRAVHFFEKNQQP